MATPARGPRQDNRRQHLLDAAAGLICRHGYHATSMRDIGRATATRWLAENFDKIGTGSAANLEASLFAPQRGTELAHGRALCSDRQRQPPGCRGLAVSSRA